MDRKRRLRNDYLKTRNKRYYELKHKYGMSYGEIASSLKHNPDGISKQRIHQLVKEYEDNIKAGEIIERY